ncbi:hypothetical protein QAD02_008160 [Eretmocerus hayati]|uniref:Uncharacterized protein n=1 Tax=Eretmocerus hayati TaxID=131215 RepID=A0ACC2N712_9HYME|nr:hypothetical protein QAD02_008160 [Eretmocerus hayati]
MQKFRNIQLWSTRFICGLSFEVLLKKPIVIRDPSSQDVTGNQRSMNYGEMDRLSDRMANFLRAKLDESKSGRDIIAVSLRPSEELPVILLAIMKSGMAYLPLDLEYPRERVDYILKDSQPAICILDTSGDNDSNLSTSTSNCMITVSCVMEIIYLHDISAVRRTR